jgi:hypothetical protein
MKIFIFLNNSAEEQEDTKSRGSAIPNVKRAF